MHRPCRAGLRQNAGMSDTPDGDVTASPGQHDETVQPPVLRPRRRPGRRAAVAVALLVVVAGAVWWRQTVMADPKLLFTVFNRVLRVEQDATGNPVGITRKENQLGTQYDVVFVPGQRFFVELGLRNEGGRAVRIDKVPLAGFYYFGFDGMEVSPDREAKTPIGAATTYQPFKPFTLGAGEGRNVRLIFRLADCKPPSGQEAGTTSIHGLLVQYKILGLGRGWVAPFEKSVLAVPSTGLCEHPITDSATARP
jgi:hypothetical protein